MTTTTAESQSLPAPQPGSAAAGLLLAERVLALARDLQIPLDSYAWTTWSGVKVQVTDPVARETLATALGMAPVRRQTYGDISRPNGAVSGEVDDLTVTLFGAAS